MTAYINLLAANNEFPALDEFAPRFFEALGVIAYEERESSNYIGGRYFKGKSDAEFIVTASLADEEHADLPIWVQIFSDSLNEQSLRSIVDGLVQAKALSSGFTCARMINFGRIDEKRVDY